MHYYSVFNNATVPVETVWISDLRRLMMFCVECEAPTSGFRPVLSGFSFAGNNIQEIRPVDAMIEGLSRQYIIRFDSRFEFVHMPAPGNPWRTYSV